MKLIFNKSLVWVGVFFISIYLKGMELPRNNNNSTRNMPVMVTVPQYNTFNRQNHYHDHTSYKEHHHHQYFDQRQRKNSLNFIQMTNDEDKFYASRLLESLKGGPLEAVKILSAKKATSLLTPLADIIYKTPNAEFESKEVRLKFTNEVVEVSAKILDHMYELAFDLEEKDQARYKAALDEVREVLFSQDYFHAMGDRFFLRKIVDFQTQALFVQQIDSFKELLSAEKDFKKKINFEILLKTKIKESIINYHTAVIDKGIDKDIDWSVYSGLTGLTTGVALAAPALIGFLIKQGLIQIPLLFGGGVAV